MIENGLVMLRNYGDGEEPERGQARAETSHSRRRAFWKAFPYNGY